MKDFFKKNRRKNNGITLVALVVTIIVLLILAGITIALLLGDNGIITKAQKAKQMYEKSAQDEEISLDKLEKQMDWDFEVVYAKKDETGCLIPIPNGYYYVEGTKNTGFVISDSKADENNPDSAEGNQYVWVPVDDINEYKLISWNGELVAEKQAENTYFNGVFSLLARLANIGSGSLGLGMQTTKTLESRSIEKYGGFYIGRYEASIDEVANVIVTKKNKRPTNVSYSKFIGEDETLGGQAEGMSLFTVNNVEIKQLGLNQSGGGASGSTAVSKGNADLVTGVQWDAMIKWLSESNASGYQSLEGNQGERAINTGSIESYKVNNIYDIAGNVSEYVRGEWYGMEVNKVYRGSNYNSSSLSASIRGNNDGSANEAIGFRMSIVIGGNSMLEQPGTSMPAVQPML